MGARGDEARGTFASSQKPRRVRDVVMVQAANEPDPENSAYGGTRTLRKSAGRKVRHTKGTPQCPCPRAKGQLACPRSRPHVLSAGRVQIMLAAFPRPHAGHGV